MNTVHLIGAEEVSRAGRAIDGAADSMQRTASSIDSAVERFDRIVARFEQATGVFGLAVDRYNEGPPPNIAEGPPPPPKDVVLEAGEMERRFTARMRELCDLIDAGTALIEFGHEENETEEWRNNLGVVATRHTGFITVRMRLRVLAP